MAGFQLGSGKGSVRDRLAPRKRDEGRILWFAKTPAHEVDESVDDGAGGINRR
jgi:hypothetical protein